MLGEAHSCVEPLIRLVVPGAAAEMKCNACMTKMYHRNNHLEPSQSDSIRLNVFARPVKYPIVSTIVIMHLHKLLSDVRLPFVSKFFALGDIATFSSRLNRTLTKMYCCNISTVRGGRENNLCYWCVLIFRILMESGR